MFIVIVIVITYCERCERAYYQYVSIKWVITVTAKMPFLRLFSSVFYSFFVQKQM